MESYRARVQDASLLAVVRDNLGFSVDQRQPTLGRNQLDDLLEMVCRVWVVENTKPGALMPSPATCAAIGSPWSMTW